MSDDHEAGTWIQIPSPPPVPKTEVIWHYTNTPGLIGILETNRLWATAVSMLNDSTEIQYGIDLAMRAYKEFIEQHRDLHQQQLSFLSEVQYAIGKALETNTVYAVCASRNGDDLGQWRGYAQGSGYALGLRATAMTGVCRPHEQQTEWRHHDLYTTWQQVLYNPEEQMELLTRLWNFVAAVTPALGVDHKEPAWVLMADTAKSAVTNAIALMKDPGFRGEEEIRFAFDGAHHPELLRFRAGPHGVTPYVELGVMPGNSPSHLVATPTPEPLRVPGVRLGPAQDQQTAQRGLQTLLRAVGRGRSATVSRSVVPYR